MRKSVSDMLIKQWGKSFEKELTDEEKCEMMKFDLEYSASIADTNRRKMAFLHKMEEKYDQLEMPEYKQQWTDKINQIKEMYPAIHKEK